jgi:hypothetical protein
MDDLTLFKWLAFLGALAWLPQIIIFIKNILTKPSISIISDKQIEVGYTSYGPIINIDLAFSSEKKDALINKICLELKHEKQEREVFMWEWFEEFLLEMAIPNQGRIPYTKKQKAFAIKVLTNSLSEKKIGFQIPELKAKANKLIFELNGMKQNILEQEQDINIVKSQKEYHSLINLSKSSFIWKVGKYEINIDVFTKENKEPFKHNIEFSLSDFDIKQLEKNIEMLNIMIENTFIIQDTEFLEKWEWVYPFKH